MFVRYAVIAMNAFGLAGAGLAQPVDYVSQIKPILAAKCYSCHGALRAESGLRLETGALIRHGGDSAAAIVPGEAESSLLLRRVTASDDERMPPVGEGAPLTETEVGLIRRWIAEGGVAPEEPIPPDPRDHWSFRPLVKPVPPAVADPTIRNPIDAFLAHDHERRGLKPAPEASAVVLLRRLHLDLTGLPPRLDSTELASELFPRWYEQSVEHLLASPEHGERWARHWMDIWRYSDWNSFNGQLRGSQKHLYHWRDWIVESLNANLPYDEMLRQMLAADELYPTDPQKLRATGYLARHWVLFNRNQWLDDTVEHVGKGLLGLTMNCAKCHDHKFDPISQHDYYAMRAFFEPYQVRLDKVPNQPDLAIDGIPRVFDGWLEKPTYLFVRGDDRQPDRSREIQPNVPKMLRSSGLQIQAVDLPAEAWQPARQPWVAETHRAAANRRVEQANSAVKRMESAEKPNPLELTVARSQACLASAERDAVQARCRAMAIAWERGRAGDGNLASDVEPMEQAAIVTAIRSERRVSAAQAELALARAELAHAQANAEQESALAAKVQTARDALGKARQRAEAEIRPGDSFTPIVGARWTPTRFIHSTKDDPPVAFPAQSSGRRTALAAWITDPQNRLTARVAANHIWTRHMGRPLAGVFDLGRANAPPRHQELLDWLAAEFVESGWDIKHLHRLIVNSAVYRRSSSARHQGANFAIDPDNESWWRREPMRLDAQVVRDSVLAHAGELDPELGGPTIPAQAQSKSRRRSLYFHHSLNDRNRFLVAFDDALPKECYQRQPSIVPQQALALLNSKLVFDCSQAIAQRLSETHPSERDFLRVAFARLLMFEPSDAELAIAGKAIQRWRSLGEFDELTARALFVRALLNHNDYVTLR